MYYGKLLRQIVEAIQGLTTDIQSEIETISGKIEAAAAEYKTNKDDSQTAPTIMGTLYRTQTEIDHKESREANKDARDTRTENRDGRRLVIEVVALCLTAILVVANIGVLIFYGLQLQQMKTATEEAGQSADASIAAVDLQDIQMRQNRLDNARAQWLQAETLMQNQKQFGETLGQSKRSLQASIDQFNLAQRPWLSVEAKVSTYDWNLGKSAVKIIYTVSVKNFGHLPASNVYLLPDNSDIKPTVGNDVVNVLIKQEQDFCDQSITKEDFINQTHTGAITIFPQQTRELVSDSYTKTGNTMVFFKGCVVYRSPTFAKLRQTGFFFEVHKKGNELDIPKPGDPLSEVILKDFSGIMNSD